MLKDFFFYWQTRLSVSFWVSNTSDFFLSYSTFASKVSPKGALRHPFFMRALFWQYLFQFLSLFILFIYFFIIIFNFSNFYSHNFLFITYLNNKIVFHGLIWLNLLLHRIKQKEIWLHLLDSYAYNWPKNLKNFMSEIIC